MTTKSDPTVAKLSINRLYVKKQKEEEEENSKCTYINMSDKE